MAEPELYEEIVQLNPTPAPDHVRAVREALTRIVHRAGLMMTERASRLNLICLNLICDAAIDDALPALDAIEAELTRLRRAAEEEHAIARDLWKGRADAAEAALRAALAPTSDAPRLADASAAMDHFRETLPGLLHSAVDNALYGALNMAAATYPHSKPASENAP